MQRLHLTAIACLALSAPRASAADSLDEGLMRKAPKVIKHLKKQEYKNVGVLKFLVSTPDGKFSDSTGTLNTLLAQRLEVALVLANDARAPVGVVKNAGAVARRVEGASHLTRDGREKLFGAKYPLAWGKEQVSPDAFLTGTVGLSKDLKTLTVGLLVFDRAGNKLAALGDDFEVENRPEYLAELGESFVLRGAFDDDAVETDPAKRAKARNDKTMSTAVAAKENKAEHPANTKDAPVSLEVRYNDKAVPVEYRGGRAFVPEPREGQEVVLVLKRDAGKERYAVVLKVNGENTLWKQRLPEAECAKWLLEPRAEPLTVRGYQVSESERTKFRVLSAVESKKTDVNYGADVGMITVTVFRERTGPAPAPPATDDAAKVAAVGKAQLPETPPEKYAALKASLLEDANRGRIDEGVPEPGAVKVVKFNLDPTPIMTLTVVYYKP